MTHRVVVITLLALCTCAYLQCAAATACDCWFGTVDTASSSQCACSCPTEFLPPYCAFAADDAPVIVVANDSPLFYSGDVLNGLREHYGITAPVGSIEAEDQISFRGRMDEDPTYCQQYCPVPQFPNGTYVIEFRIAGPLASQFLISAAANETWITALNIVQVWIKKLPASKKEEFAENMMLFKSGDIVVSVNTVGWLLGAIFIFLVLCCTELCFFSATEAKCSEVEFAEAGAKYDQRAQQMGTVEALPIQIATPQEKQPHDDYYGNKNNDNDNESPEFPKEDQAAVPHFVGEAL